MSENDNDATTAAESIEKLKEKDGEANNESARTNEILAKRAGVTEDGETEAEDPAEASIRLNDPSRSRNAYTSHESGFVEDLPEREDEVELPKAKDTDQQHVVND